ncbi:MAG: ferritin family protein [Desulfobacterales bacterium]|nr:MAG: ferritin family protein [Desulfobacterales bacterium]
MFSIDEILDLAIRIEQNGEAVYRDAIKEISQPELVSLLEWMADEEVTHARWFAELKMKIATSSANPFVEEMSRALFADLLGEKSFSHQDVDFSQVDDLDELIAIFIEFERDTVIFYETLQPFIEDEDTREHLKKIIAEENNHITQLMEFTSSDAAFSLNVDDH